MNKYIEEYIEKRKKEIEEEKTQERIALLNKLKLGEREYYKDFPNESYENFPCYDGLTNEYFRYNRGDISDDDIAELIKYVPKDEIIVSGKRKKMSGWYVFSIVMMILSIIGGIVAGILMMSIITCISAIIGSIVFFSPLILLCKIEYNTREK